MLLLIIKSYEKGLAIILLTLLSILLISNAN